MIIYTDPDFPLNENNIFHSCEFYKSFQDFEKKNKDMRALIIIPKSSFPKSKKKEGLPMIRNYPVQALTTYKKNYPLLSLKEIIEEIALYEKAFIESGILKSESGDHHKYLKGWLTRAQKEKEQTARKQFL